MVQDFTTSFDQFETFAVSEMAKQPENNNQLSPFTPKFWSNRDPLNSFFETPITEGSLQDLFLTPRRSNRIANQTKVDYNENIPKKGEHSKKSRQGNLKRNKAIKKLFKKPSDVEIAKKNPKSGRVKRVKKVGKRPNKLCISIPLIQTTLLTTSVTKGSLKLFENVLTMKSDEHTMMEVIDEMDDKVEMETVLGKTKNCQIKNSVDIFDTSKKNIQLEQKNVFEAFEERERLTTLKTIQASNKIKLPTENRIANVFGNRFSGIFKSFNEVVFADSSKENEKLKYNTTSNSSDTKFRQFNRISDNTPNISEKLEQNIVNKAFEDDFMEVSEENQDPINIKTRNESSEDCQMMEISNEIDQYLEKKYPKGAEDLSEENAIFKETNKPDRSIIKEAEEKEQPLDLTIIDTSNKICRQRKIDVKNQSIITEQNFEVFEDSTQMDVVSNEIPSSEKNISNDAQNRSPDYSVSISDLLQKDSQPDQNFNTECGEESDKIRTRSMSIIQNDKQTTAATQGFEECTVLSDNLSIIKISEQVHKPENINEKAFEDKDEPFNLKIGEVSEELQNLNASNEVDDISIVENNSFKQNNITGDSKKYQCKSSESTMSAEPDENQTDHQDFELDKNEDIIIEELKSLIEECPLDGSDRSYDVNSTETVVIEVEINEESNDSVIEVTEESFLNNSENDENTNEEGFNKNSDDEEMLFSQGNRGVYQQEFIEVIHQYNYFPFQNYQYPRYEYPINDENKFDNPMPNSLPFLSQRYGEFQIPQMYWDYNNCRMQFHGHGNFEHENKLEITDYYDSEEEEKEKELDINKNSPKNKNSNKKQLILSQPPPIQFSSEQKTTQVSLQSQSQIGQICENSSHFQEYSQNNSESTNNQWQIVSTQNSGHTSSEQRDCHLYENTICSIQVFQQSVNEENQSESQIVQRIDQVAPQNIHNQQPQTQIIARQHQGMSLNNQGLSLNNQDQGHQPLSEIADFVKNNCRIHDVKFGKIKILNGRMYRTGSLLITFGDHYQVQIIGDLIFNNINENIAFDAFFRPRNKF